MKEHSLHMSYEEAVEWQKNWKAPRWEDCKLGENGKPCYVCQKVIDSRKSSSVGKPVEIQDVKTTNEVVDGGTRILTTVGN